MIDNEHLDRSLGRFEFQAELFLDGIEDGWWVIRWLHLHVVEYRVVFRRFEMEGKKPTDSGPIDNRPFERTCKNLGKVVDGNAVRPEVEVDLEIHIVSAAEAPGLLSGRRRSRRR